MDDEDLAIGIDLGTTYSCAAVLINEKVEIIPNEIGENITPSVVSFVDDGVLVGEQTLNQLIKNPKKTIYSIKRLMGKNFNDEEVQKDLKSNFWSFDIIEHESSHRPRIKIEKENKEFEYYYPEQISKFILEKMAQSARNYLNKPIKKAVITVPAYFNDAQRKATRLAATQAGLEVLRIINEPTAASLAYGLDKKLPKNKRLATVSSLYTSFELNLGEKYIDENTEKNEEEDEDERLIIVFDLGGGTFDVTLLNILDQEIFNVIATSGDSHLGGDDFDKKIMDFCLKDFCSKFNIKEDEIKNDTKAMNRLKIASEKAKIRLSSEGETNIYIDEFYNKELLHIKLKRETFENICQDLFNKLIKPLDKVIEDAKKGVSDIKEIVFVGGSTRIPKIKELIHNYFFDVNINDSINPDEAVAYGAAIQAAKIIKQGTDILNDVILTDINPFSLGIEIINNIVADIEDNYDIDNIINDVQKINLNDSNDIELKKTCNISNNNQIEENIENQDNFNEENIYILERYQEGLKKGEEMSVLIPRGTKIPIKKENIYYTSYDYQEEVRIAIYEGENKYVKDNHLLGEFLLSGLPQKLKGEVNIIVTFDVDINGILTVTAMEESEGIQKSIKIINDRGFNEDEIIEEIRRSKIALLNNENQEIKNYKKEMNYYLKLFDETYNQEEKYKYIYNFSEILINFINTFEKEGNDTLGNKYFLYIKALFEAYKTIIKLRKELNEKEKSDILSTSKYFLKILSTFKNPNYKKYIELLYLFDNPLDKLEKKEPIETQKKIIDTRNYILFDLVTYSIELIKEKAEEILSNKLKFSRYNSKYLFQNCIQISELFIGLERELAKFIEIRNRHNKCIETCKSQIKKIEANSLIEIDNIKNSGKLIENEEKMERQELLLLLDNYRQALESIEGLNDYESEAIILANIVKINYKFLKSENYGILRTMAEQSVALAKCTNKNVEQFKWYLEISNILQEIRKRFEDKERFEQETFENNFKNDENEIFEEIKEYRKKTNVEFIEFILERYPPHKNPIKKNRTVQEEWNKNPKSLVEKLSARYNPDNYSKKTEEEKLMYTIYHTISTELNGILLELNPNRHELKE